MASSGLRISAMDAACNGIRWCRWNPGTYPASFFRLIMENRIIPLPIKRQVMMPSPENYVRLAWIIDWEQWFRRCYLIRATYAVLCSAPQNGIKKGRSEDQPFPLYL